MVVLLKLLSPVLVNTLFFFLFAVALPLCGSKPGINILETWVGDLDLKDIRYDNHAHTIFR